MIDENLLLQLHNNGKTNRMIAKQLSIHHKTVATILCKHNKASVWGNEQIHISPNGAICSKCYTEKPIDQFQHGRKGSTREYRFSYCKDCRNRQTYLNLNSNIESFLSDRYNRLRLRSIKYNIPFKITKERFIAIYHLQHGKCIYSGIDMVCRVGNKVSKESFSVDKVIPTLGYIDGNIVFCCNRINTIKQDVTLQEMQSWMPLFYSRLIGMKDVLGLTCLQVAEGNF